MNDLVDRLVIAPVTLETRGDFAAMLEEARAWQRSRRAEGWDYPFDDAWMLPRIERGELFLVLLDDAPVAAFRLLWEDIPFWGEREVGDSLYLHSFAVSRRRAGDGIGPAVIERLARLGRERGRRKLRLDCALSSETLIAFYERNGFVSSGTILLDGKMFNLMERVL